MDFTYLFFGLVFDTQLGQRILYALLEKNSSINTPAFKHTGPLL